MFHREVALEALSTLLNATVTSKQRTQVQVSAAGSSLSIQHFIPTLVKVHEISQGRFNFLPIPSILKDDPQRVSEFIHTIDEEEFFDPVYDYDFTDIKDTETFYRGEEKYERPSGWYRYALKVLDKYEDNIWLGTRYRRTTSDPGEWPVSYHGTSIQGAEGIIKGHYKPGPRDVYGRGIYSTPDINEATRYAKKFTSINTGKTYEVILQNRINPKYREKHNNDKYWLIKIPAGTADKEEHQIVGNAIRPYGLLLKEVK